MGCKGLKFNLDIRFTVLNAAGLDISLGLFIKSYTKLAYLVIYLVFYVFT